MSKESTDPNEKETDKKSSEAKSSDTPSQNPEMPQPFFSIGFYSHQDDKLGFTINRPVEETNPNTSAAFVGGAMPIPSPVLGQSLKSLMARDDLQEKEPR